MKKEMMVTAATSDDAMQKLQTAFSDYIGRRVINDWRWIVEPEARQRDDQWRAYGRIEYKK